MSFDYRNLSPIEFERLCSDLLTIMEGVRYQRFGEGRDDGVDLLYENVSRAKTIVQCKRYRDTSQLLYVLKHTERKKVFNLKPARYCLLTTASLSPRKKDEILSVFHPYIKTTQDIIGLEELDDLLSSDRCQQAVCNIPSLWLPSFKLVSTCVNNAVIGRSRSELSARMARCSRFAWTTVCDACLKRIETAHVVILVGDPGMGKTVTAEMLSCRLHLMGYDVYVSYEGVKEFEDVYQPGLKQAFLYDDFLGSNYFDAVRNREDSQICQFANRVSRDTDKCFILTSRTTILSRGIECSSVFKIHRFAADSRLIDVNQLSVLDKAHVLYKLLRMSRCRESALVEYVRDKKYWDTLKHNNFNPRVVDYIVQGESVGSVGTGIELATMLSQALSNPMEVWRDVFNNQIDRAERVLVWVTYLNGGISEIALNEVYDKLLLLPPFRVQQGLGRTFLSVTRTLVGSLLKRSLSNEGDTGRLINEIFGMKQKPAKKDDPSASYALQNHSIADFLGFSWQEDTLSVKLALELLDSKLALDTFIKIANSGDKKCKESILSYLIADECSVTSVVLRLVAYFELIKDGNDLGMSRKAFAYVQKVNAELIDQQSSKPFIRILERLNAQGLPVKDFLQELPAKSIRYVFSHCNCIQDAIALYKLSPRATFSDAKEFKDDIADLLVEFGRDKLDSWYAPNLEFDEESGKMRASSHDVERIERDLESEFKDILSEMDIFQDVIDLEQCVVDVDVNEFYTTDYDGIDDFNDDRVLPDYGGKQIDDLFAGLVASE